VTSEALLSYLILTLFTNNNRFELGGITFCVTLLWAQIFPFVGLHFYDGDRKDNITMFLMATFGLWFVLNLAFLCTIDLKYVTR